MKTIVGVLVVAAVATVGDASWYTYVVRFFAWAFAWGPGLFTLTFGGAPVPTSASARTTSSTTPLASAPVADTDSPIAAVELLERIDRGERPCILDVRSEGEFAAGH